MIISVQFFFFNWKMIGVLSVKVDAAHNDQKPNTPRSKHSATEQRRRSKINDRYTTCILYVVSKIPNNMNKHGEL